jgi:hypothetical protein
MKISTFFPKEKKKKQKIMAKKITLMNFLHHPIMSSVSFHQNEQFLLIRSCFRSGNIGHNPVANVRVWWEKD